VLDAIKQAGGGFLSGFTASISSELGLDVKDAPDNEYEAIARKMGELAGFAPGILSAPLKTIGLKGLAAKSAALNKKSLPMAGADLAQKQVKKIIKPILEKSLQNSHGASKTAMDFITSGPGMHMAEGAFHLGVASSISNWRGIVDGGMEEFVNTFKHGAEAGAVFRGLGNLIPGDKAADLWLRRVSGSLYMGIPSTERGDSTPEQVYEYLLGAYFGGAERPWYVAKAGKFNKRMYEQSENDPELRRTQDPTLVKGWQSLDPIVQKEVVRMTNKRLGGSTADERRGDAYELMREFGIIDKLEKAEDINTKGFKLLNQVIDGEVQPDKNAPPSEKLHHMLSLGNRGVKGTNRNSADEVFADKSVEYGNPIYHYTFGTVKGKPGHSKTIKAKGGKRELSQTELNEATEFVDKANLSLGKIIGRLNTYKRNLIRRAHAATKHASSIYAIDNLRPDMKGVQSKSAEWTVQMAIDKKRPVYVYDQQARAWYKYNYNKNIQRFQAIEGTPKLKKFALGTGTNDINKYGKAAIKDLFKVTYGEMEGAAETESVPRGKEETWMTIQSEIERLQKEDVDDPQIKKLMKKQADILGIKSKEYLDAATGEVKEDVEVDIDIGQMIDAGIGKRSKRWIDAWYDDMFPKGRKGTQVKKGVDKLFISSRIEKLLREHLPAGEEASTLIARDFKKLFKKNIPDAALGEIRQWVTAATQGKPVRFLKSDGGKVYLTRRDKPFTMGGKNKLVMAPPSALEEAFLEATNTKLKEFDKKNPAGVEIILDEVTVRDRNGFQVDIPLSRYESHLVQHGKKGKKEAAQIVNNFIGRTIKFMYDKHGMVPHAGVGDKDRIIFAKNMYDFADKMPKASRKLVFDVLKQKNVKTDKLLFRVKFGLDKKFADKIYKETFISNLTYDALMNFGNKVKTPVLKKWINSKFGKGRGDFINNAVALNKRNQIWFTNSFRASDKHIENYLEDLGTNDIVDGKTKGIIVNELPKGFKEPKNPKNSQTAESTDGGVILRDDYVEAMNSDGGYPTVKEAGQLKAFIVSPDATLGALLTKKMYHSAGPAQSEAMKKAGISHIIYGSSAKQRGFRPQIDHDVVNGELVFDKKGMIDIPLKDIRYTYSTRQGQDMLENRMIVKQALMHIHPNAQTPIDNDVIDDFFKGTIGERFTGTHRGSRIINDYLQDFSDKKIDKIIDNFDEIGIPDIIKALKTNGAETLAEQIYVKMLKVNKKSLQEAFARGELSNEDVKILDAELEDSFSDVDRMITQSRIFQMQNPDAASFSIFDHKYVRGWREQSMRNAIVQTATQPIMSNSLLTRMRPYDKWAQQGLDNPETKRLEKEQDIFFLDNAFKNKEMRTILKGYERTTLEKLWKFYNKSSTSKKDKAYLEDVFNAVSLRVPLDSISGAQVLKFAGFSGRPGHGVMLHGKVMRREGGADLDGDESFIYFGGKLEDGTGYGMKNSWKKMYSSNANEFMNEKGYETEAKTKEMRDLFTLDVSESMKERMMSPEMTYSPNQRMFVGMEAAKGRDMLKNIISNSQVMKSAWNSVMAKPGKEDMWTFTRREQKGKKGKSYTVTYRIKVKANDTTEAMKLQRDMTRAQTAFGADPLDELGLKEADVFHSTLWNAYFTPVKIEKMGFAGTRWKNVKLDKFKLKRWEMNGGAINTFRDLNSALYSKNYTANRKWSAQEIANKVLAAGDILPGESNTMLPKIGKLFSGLDWSDNIFNRINKKLLVKVYDSHDTYALKKDYMKDILGRNTLRAPFNNYVENVMGGTKELKNGEIFDYGYKDLQAPGVIEAVARSRRLFQNALSGLDYYKTDRPRIKEALNSIPKREAILREIVREGNNMIYEDMTDMTTVQLAVEMIEKTKTSGKLVKKMMDFENTVKRKSYIQARKRKDRGTYEGPETQSDVENERKMKIAEDILTKVFGTKKEAREKLGIGEQRTAELDQAEIDQLIKDFRKDNKLNKGQNLLLDYFLLGSLRRGDVQKLNDIISKIPPKEWNSALYDVVRYYQKQASDTGMSKLAFNSSEVSNLAIQNFLGKMNGLFSKSFQGDKVDVEAEIAEHDKERVIETADGKKMKESLVERTVDDLLEEEFAPDGTGYTGLKKVKISKERRQVVQELADNLKALNPNVAKHLNEIVRGTMEKDLNAMTKEDFEVMNNIFKEFRRGTFWQRVESWVTGDVSGKTDPLQRVQKRSWWEMPLTVNRELMQKHIMFMKQKGIFFDKDGEVRSGWIRKPTQAIGVLNEYINNALGKAVGVSDDLIRQFREETLFLKDIKEGDELWEIAVRKRELGIMNEIWSDASTPEIVRAYWASRYKNAYNDALKKHNWDRLKTREYVIEENGEKVKRSSEEIVERINSQLTERFAKMHDFIKGDKDALEPFREGWYDPKGETQPIINTEKFLKYAANKFAKGEDISSKFGIDGLRHIARSMMIELAPNAKEKKRLLEFIIEDTGKLDYQHYFPHMHFSRTEANNSLKEAIRAIRETPDSIMDAETKDSEVDKITLRHKSLTGDWDFYDIKDWDKHDAAVMKASLERIGSKRAEKGDQLKWYNANQRSGSMMSRNSHVPGWAVGQEVVESYMRNLSNTYYRQLSQIMSRHVIEQFKDQGKKLGWDKVHYGKSSEFYPKGRSLMDRWVDWLKLYVQDSIGNPSVIPEEMYKDPGMKLKGNVYGWFADNHVRDVINKVGENLMPAGKNWSKDLPPEMRGIDLATIRDWSNLEAKYQLMTLLAHPKSTITNVFGGAMHTIESVGVGTFRKARDLEYLRQINPEWDSMDKVKDFVVKHGVLPEFILNEAGLDRSFKSANAKAFIKDVVDKYTNEKYSFETLRGLAKKHGVSNAIMNKAGAFMSKPELMLRRDAFMAHYIRAYESFGGAIKDINHPFLIQKAKEGVKATQFLYNAPNRPAFARTALGKVMTRFQLWAWNSVRFRNDVLRQAKIYGYKEGTEAMKKFERTAQIDMFVIALANAYQFSIFEFALPAPYNWLQDTADWVFGDEKERDRAFYGAWPSTVAPLQIVTPPIARVPLGYYKGWVSGDYSHMTDYILPVSFPFGRMARDIYNPWKPEDGLLMNPLKAVDKITGFPLQSISWDVSDYKRRHGIGRKPKKEKVKEKKGTALGRYYEKKNK